MHIVQGQNKDQLREIGHVRVLDEADQGHDQHQQPDHRRVLEVLQA